MRDKIEIGASEYEALESFCEGLKGVNNDLRGRLSAAEARAMSDLEKRVEALRDYSREEVYDMDVDPGWYNAVEVRALRGTGEVKKGTREESMAQAEGAEEERREMRAAGESET